MLSRCYHDEHTLTLVVPPLHVRCSLRTSGEATTVAGRALVARLSVAVTILVTRLSVAVTILVTRLSVSVTILVTRLSAVSVT